MKTTIKSLCAIGLSLLAMGVAKAFWSKYIYRDHQDITKISLSAPNIFTFSAGTSPGSYSFSANAIVQINAAHEVVDTPANYFAPNHFDSNSLQESFQQMRANREDLNTVLSTQPIDQAKAWMLLGFMLHAAQDFYSHSTWVDEGGSNTSNPINFGFLTESTSPPTGPFSDPGPGNYCVPVVGFPLLPPVNHLITGFYPPAVTPSGGCIHGNLYLTVASCAASALTGITVVPGISHDIPCALPFSSANAQHLTARSLALKETLQFVQAIVADLSNVNNAAGFCALLDLPSNSAVCSNVILTANPSWVVSGATVTFSVVVGPPGGSVTIPTGTAAINDETGNTVCTVTLTSTGTGTCSYVYPSTQPHTYTAAYAGNQTFSAAKSPSINTAPYTVTLIAPPSGDYIFEAKGVNSSGDFLGLACAPNQQCDFANVPTEAFVYHNGQYFNLNTLAPTTNVGFGSTDPQAISETGTILTTSQPTSGSNAPNSVFLLTRTADIPLSYSTTIVAPPSGDYIFQAKGVDSSGDFVGFACASGSGECGFNSAQNNEGFLYHNGQYFDLNTLAPATNLGFGFTGPQAISESGSILTISQSGSNAPQSVFLLTRTTDSPLSYLTTLIAPPSGDYIFEANGVNSSGDFVGLACAPQQQCDFNNVPNEAFIYHDGQYLNLITLAPSINLGNFTIPQAIAESGSILTISQPASGSNAAQSVFLLSAPYLPKFSIVATVTGLNGILILQNSNGNTISVSGTGGSSIAVLPVVPSGSNYSITVSSQPSKQNCSVSNGSGIVSGALVTNVSVACN